MKILPCLLAAAIGLAVSAGESVFFRFQRYGSTREWVLAESFLLNDSSVRVSGNLQKETEKLEKLYAEKLASIGDAMGGEFLVDGEKVQWTRQVFLIQPGMFSIDLKSSGGEFKFSGLLSKVEQDGCDISLDFARLRPIETIYGPGVDQLSGRHSSSRRDFGKIYFFGSGGGKVTGKGQPESKVAVEGGEIVKLTEGGFDAAELFTSKFVPPAETPKWLILNPGERIVAYSVTAKVERDENGISLSDVKANLFPSDIFAVQYYGDDNRNGIFDAGDTPGLTVTKIRAEVEPNLDTTLVSKKNADGSTTYVLEMKLSVTEKVICNEASFSRRKEYVLPNLTHTVIR